ncbi:MAG: hypothetical protein ACR2QK_22215 [Acidimicrobiales bacterium]
MTIIAKLRGLAGRSKRRRPEKRSTAGDGHAPGHRHLEFPASDPEPGPTDVAPRRNQPWVRTTHSDSQQRRPRK